MILREHDRAYHNGDITPEEWSDRQLGSSSLLLGPKAGRALLDRGRGALSRATKGAGKVAAKVDDAPNRTLDAIENWRLGGKLYNPAKMDSLRAYLNKRGFKLRLDGDDVLPQNVAAGFDGVKKELIFRRNATEFEVWHELSHLRHYQKIGPDAYNALTRVQKEQFVFDLLENSKKR